MFSSVAVLGSDTDRLKEGQVTAGSRVWPLVLFFKKHGLSDIQVVIGEDFQSEKEVDACDVLAVIEQKSESQVRKLYVEKKIAQYKQRGLPVLCGAINTIEKEFVKMAFGDSLDLLKDSNIPLATRSLFVICRFFKKGETFSSVSFREKVRQYTGVEFKSPNAAATISNFVDRGMIKTLVKGKYFFQGLDDKSYHRLKSFNFDVTEDMLLPVTKVQVDESENNKLVSHDELVKVMEDLKASLHEEVKRILITTKINERLLRMDAKDLQKAEALLDVFASQP